MDRLILLKGIYPNPMVDECKIYFLMRSPAEVLIDVYNVAGEIIVHRAANLARGVNIQVWKGENEAGGRCASGVYLVSVKALNAAGEHDEFWASVAIAR